MSARVLTGRNPQTGVRDAPQGLTCLISAVASCVVTVLVLLPTRPRLGSPPALFFTWR